MPLYEYQCDGCGHRFEQIRKFSDPPLEACPKCGAPVRKLVSSPAFQFKGSGWYVSDYGGKSKASEKAKEAKDSGGSSDAKSESKESTGTKDSTTKESSAKSDAPAASTDAKTKPA